MRIVKATDDQIGQWLNAIDELTYSEQSTFRYIERSFRIFEQSLSSEGWGQAAVEIAGAVMDWLGTMRTALSHWQRRLTRDGKQEPFLAVCRHEYDTVFAYRFLYRLRNYAQHLALPVHAISRKKDGWSLTLDRNALIEQFDGWSTVAAELQAGPSEIFVEPLVRSCMESLTRIAEVVAQAERENWQQVRAAIDEAHAYFVGNHGGDDPIVYWTPDDPGFQVGASIRYEPTPTWKQLQALARSTT
jgi:hypothetical protein